MPRGFFATVKVRGVALAIEALAHVDETARTAQLAAMARAASAAKKGVQKRMVPASHGVPMDIWRKRIRTYRRARQERRGIAIYKLWGGFGALNKYRHHPAIAAALRTAYPLGFLVTFDSGHQAWVERRKKPRRVGKGARGIPEWNNAAQKRRNALPIDEKKINIVGLARQIFIEEAKLAMRGVYVDSIAQEFKRRVQRIYRAEAARVASGR
jgi:hypothetical protein